MSCHVTEKLFLQMHPPTLEKIVLKVCGRKELSFSTEQIPSPWEFSFSNFPKDVLCGCSMIFYYVNMIGPPGPMKTQWPLWSSPRENKRSLHLGCLPLYAHLVMPPSFVRVCRKPDQFASSYVSAPQLPDSLLEVTGWYFVFPMHQPSQVFVFLLAEGFLSTAMR